MIEEGKYRIAENGAVVYLKIYIFFFKTCITFYFLYDDSIRIYNNNNTLSIEKCRPVIVYTTYSVINRKQNIALFAKFEFASNFFFSTTKILYFRRPAPVFYTPRLNDNYLHGVFLFEFVNSHDSYSVHNLI